MPIWLKVCKFILNYATALLFIGILVGLFIPVLPPILSPFLSIFIWLMLFITMLQCNWRRIVVILNRPFLIALIAIWLLLISPGIIFLAGYGLELDKKIIVLAVIWAAAPPLMGSPALCRFVGLDNSLSLGILMVTTIIAPFIMPFIVITGLGVDLQIGPMEMLLRLVLFVGSAFGLALTIQFTEVCLKGNWVDPTLDLSLLMLLLLFAIGIVDGVTATFFKNPIFVIKLLVTAIILIIALHTFGTLIFIFLGRLPALTLGLSSGMRNMAILLGALPSSLNPDILLFLAIVQFPIYMAPVFLKPIFQWILKRTENKSIQNF